jgi:hypothetical protein
MLLMLLWLRLSVGFSQDLELDTREALELIKKWNFASNAMSESTLREIYADKLIFYTQSLSKERCISEKKAIFKSNPDFKQKITSDPKFVAYTAGVLKADFNREVFERGKWKSLHSYLLISYENNRYVISAESDLETDRRKNYKLSIGTAMDIPQPSTTQTPFEKSESSVSDSLVDTAVVDTTAERISGTTPEETQVEAEDSIVSSVTEEVLSDETVAVPKKYVYLLIGVLVFTALIVVLARRPKKSAPKERNTSNELQIHRKETGFENFVLTHFDPHYFTLKTNRREPVYAGNVKAREFIPTLEFEFQNKDSRVRLAIECIFIPKLTGQHLLSYSSNQINRYHHFEQDHNSEVYLIIGLEGEPGDPKELFLIPTSELREGYLGYKDLQPYKKHGMFFYNSVRGRLL